MAYSAIDIARYIVDYCTEHKSPISNLKLQKMLYYVWIDYYKQTDSMLFSEEMCAWQLGPVVPEVYYEFCSYAGIPISRSFDIDIASSDRAILDASINRYLPIPASQLVSKTHKKGSPWDRIYREGEGNRDVIPYSLIISLEC